MAKFWPEGHYGGYQRASGGKKHSGPHGRAASSGAELARAKGEQYKLARMRPIWVLHATEANLDNRAPFFKKESNS